jgi:nucleoside phosphorylase
VLVRALRIAMECIAIAQVAQQDVVPLCLSAASLAKCNA